MPASIILGIISWHKLFFNNQHLKPPRTLSPKRFVLLDVFSFVAIEHCSLTPVKIINNPASLQEAGPKLATTLVLPRYCWAICYGHIVYNCYINLSSYKHLKNILFSLDWWTDAPTPLKPDEHTASPATHVHVWSKVKLKLTYSKSSRCRRTLCCAFVPHRSISAQGFFHCSFSLNTGMSGTTCKKGTAVLMDCLSISMTVDWQGNPKRMSQPCTYFPHPKRYTLLTLAQVWR